MTSAFCFCSSKEPSPSAQVKGTLSEYAHKPMHGPKLKGRSHSWMAEPALQRMRAS